jgi:hypothetical protein
MFNKLIALDEIRHEPQTSVAFVVQIFKNRTSSPGRPRHRPTAAHRQPKQSQANVPDPFGKKSDFANLVIDGQGKRSSTG